MGGKSKSSTSSNTSSTQTTTNKTLNAAASDLENSAVVMNSGDNAQITTTDYGAVKAAAVIADRALETADNSLEVADNHFSRASNIAFESLELSAQAVDTLAYSQNANTAAIERVAKSATTGGQSIIAESLVKVFQPFALALLALTVVFAIYFMVKGRKRV